MQQCKQGWTKVETSHPKPDSGCLGMQKSGLCWILLPQWVFSGQGWALCLKSIFCTAKTWSGSLNAVEIVQGVVSTTFVSETCAFATFLSPFCKIDIQLLQRSHGLAPCSCSLAPPPPVERRIRRKRWNLWVGIKTV